ncbi:hypothetical protein P879_10260 [Paragonimus westermani]|uniref:Uncharacterized protein n=1 Tax=Paragonimus westermani TaxID=34504 RepID=A0A8T0DE60_9TREM|nr:hypothetical protein P879_10260 [Paragonimus westermani]
MGARFIEGDTSIVAIKSISSKFIEQGTASTSVPYFAQTAARLDWIVQDSKWLTQLLLIPSRQ